jgi:23S rRNA (uracil1939-C5)-methyltransferase
LQTLLESGYFLQTIQLVDMFPQTFHLETVTVLVRG